MINNSALNYLKSRIRKNVINQEEYDKIKLESQAAKDLYEDKRFSFLIDFLNNNKKYILDLIAKNDLKDVTETSPSVVTITSNALDAFAEEATSGIYTRTPDVVSLLLTVNPVTRYGLVSDFGVPYDLIFVNGYNDIAIRVADNYYEIV